LQREGASLCRASFDAPEGFEPCNYKKRSRTLAHQTLFCVALTLFAVLIVAGIKLLERRPWLGAGLASLGAVLGGISLFWTVAALFLAIAIVALSVVCARRVSAQTVEAAFLS
jgi:hypothetical protein